MGDIKIGSLVYFDDKELTVAGIDTRFGMFVFEEDVEYTPVEYSRLDPPKLIE